MDQVADIRLRRLRQLIDERYKGRTQKEVAEALGLPDASYLSRILSKKKRLKNLGEDSARDIEVRERLPKYWMDGHDGVAPAGRDVVSEQHPITLYGIQMSIEAARLAEQFDKLKEPERSVLRNQIYLAVADQVRHGRNEKPATKKERSSRKDEGRPGASTQ